MSARFVYAGKKKRPRPIWGLPSFCVGWKNPKNAQFLPISLGGPMGPIRPLWAIERYNCPEHTTVDGCTSGTAEMLLMLAPRGMEGSATKDTTDG